MSKIDKIVYALVFKDKKPSKSRKGEALGRDARVGFSHDAIRWSLVDVPYWIN